MSGEIYPPVVEFADVDIVLDALRFRVEEHQALNQSDVSDSAAEAAIRTANEAYHFVAEQAGVTHDMDKDQRYAALSGRIGTVAIEHIKRDELVEALRSYSRVQDSFSDEAKRAQYLAQQYAE